MENKFELLQNQAVLVKDYFKRVRDEDFKFSPAMIFTNIKGAYSSTGSSNEKKF